MSNGTFAQDNPELALMLEQVGLIETPTKEEVAMPADFGELNKNFKAEANTDDNEFKPIKGAYITRVEKLEHKKGEAKSDGNPYDFYAIRLQVTETVEGEKGDNRFLDKTYRNDNEGLTKMFKDMFTAKIDIDRSSEEALDASLGSAKDKTVKVRAWRWTPEKDMKGNVIPVEDRTARQQFKIINEFKLGQEGKVNESKKASEVPF